MAITKIHPIKTTLHYAIDYITDQDKTDQQLLVSSHMCHYKTAHRQFLETRQEHHTKGTVLARHLIQSFYPGEVDMKTAHQIGQELCQKIFQGQYEYVLTTHIDRGHIHNHIIFNNVSYQTGRCYQSNKRSYHQIRQMSDKLCEKYNLSVIDDNYHYYKKHFKSRGRSHYEWEQNKQGKSWKSRLQFLIDLNISRSQTWKEFLERMKKAGFEIKEGKHIAFREPNTSRFTRSKRFGSDYTTERLKERIQDNPPQSLVHIGPNHIHSENKGYEFWAKKHNLKTMAAGLVELRELGIHSLSDLEGQLEKRAERQLEIQQSIKQLDKEMEKLSQQMEDLHHLKKFKPIYQTYQKEPDNHQFQGEYRYELSQYKQARERLGKAIPSSSNLLNQLKIAQEKKNTLMTEYSQVKNQFQHLYQHKKNYESYMKEGRER